MLSKEIGWAGLATGVLGYLKKEEKRNECEMSTTSDEDPETWTGWARYGDVDA